MTEKPRTNKLDYYTTKERPIHHKSDHIESYEYELIITRGEKTVGQVTMQHFVKPINFYEVSHIHVNNTFHGGFRNQGIGRDIILNINSFLNKKKKPGILLDMTIDLENHDKAVGYYQRHGWTKVSQDTDTYYVYNVEGMSKEDIEKMVKTYFLSSPKMTLK
jgi:ribosomal protein S18 acetylase RimI-like enzyme